MKRYMVTLGIEVNDEDADDLIRKAKEMYHSPAADFDLDREEFIDWEESRMLAVEQQLLGVQQNVFVVHQHLSQIDNRLERIERRLRSD